MHAEVDLHEQQGARLGNAANTNATTTAYSSLANQIDAKAKVRIDEIIAANLK